MGATLAPTPYGTNGLVRGSLQDPAHGTTLPKRVPFFCPWPEKAGMGLGHSPPSLSRSPSTKPFFPTLPFQYSALPLGLPQCHLREVILPRGSSWQPSESKYTATPPSIPPADGHQHCPVCLPPLTRASAGLMLLAGPKSSFD